ncbi:unnamed protein product [Brachionus calyciflorus]|uniref:Uncharacterized protein n=1 Tax=Brachionus calyciflorus TaxID=104777 RepID=A0A814C214_9BILA|nr:unnamed protein product [Brachionus calyciflorus]
MMREESSFEEIIDEAARYEKAVSDVLEFPERSKKVEFEEKIEKYYYKPQNPSHQQQHSQQQQHQPQQQSYRSNSDKITCYQYKIEGHYISSFPLKNRDNVNIDACLLVGLFNADGHNIKTLANVKVKVEINKEKNDLETIVVKNLVNDFILGLDGLEMLETPRRLLDVFKEWTTSSIYKFEPGKFSQMFKKDVIKASISETKISETKALTEYSNNINSKHTTKMSDFDENKLNEAREETYKNIEDILATNLTDLKPTSDTNHTIELTDKTPFCIRTI